MTQVSPARDEKAKDGQEGSKAAAAPFSLAGAGQRHRSPAMRVFDDRIGPVCIDGALERGRGVVEVAGSERSTLGERPCAAAGRAASRAGRGSGSRPARATPAPRRRPDLARRASMTVVYLVTAIRL